MPSKRISKEQLSALMAFVKGKGDSASLPPRLQKDWEEIDLKRTSASLLNEYEQQLAFCLRVGITPKQFHANFQRQKKQTRKVRSGGVQDSTETTTEGM